MLPDIDDGAKSIEMSLLMARESVACGVSDVVVTPHHGNGCFDNFANHVKDAVISTQKLLDENNIVLRLHPGSELHLTLELVQQLQEKTVLTYADKGKAALIELPKNHLPIGTEDILQGCLNMGITPLIAHPERNTTLLNQPALLEDWVRNGIKSQLTAMSVTGRFGEKLRKASNRWIKRGCVHIVASDAHRPTGRSPDLSAAYSAVENKFGPDIAGHLFVNNPQRLLDGEDLISVGKVGNSNKRPWVARLLNR